MKDVVIVGGGLAGLSAAWRSRFFDTLLLESEPRIGGRVRSERRGSYWLNWGGHMYAGPGSATDTLFNETGIEAVEIPGSLTGFNMNGKTLYKGTLATYPLRLPISLDSRVAAFTVGARILRSLIMEYMDVVKVRPGESAIKRQQRVYDFQNEISFREWIGRKMPRDAEEIFDVTVTRCTGSVDDISAGTGIGYFSLVLGIGAGLNRGVMGGPSTLTETIAARLGDRVQLGAEVVEVVPKKDSVVVRYRQNGEDHEVEARTVVMATTATVTNRVTKNLPQDLRDALGQIKYGNHVVTSVMTNETTPKKWDDVYCIAAPKRSFSILTNQSSIVRGSEKERQPGSTFMVFSPGAKGAALINKTDEEIIDIHLNDMNEVLGEGFRNSVVEAETWRLPEGAPYCFPGRGKLQPTLLRGTERIKLAGDYLGTMYTETSVATGFQAAQDAMSLIATENQRGLAPKNSLLSSI
ncbi:protoporphyrinogen/coproporphyrinogen oxidase [Arthrobacter sp. NPDC056727]|uniref:protoporphyrinogen/coproporphyrinogen oxidase n=1 Tax=Arthrobacter sp. NPDC056727 TaxID=3345927 RepID=UPI00366EBE37